jgi:hypothetical protein
MKPQVLPLGVALALCAAAPLSAQTLATWDSPVKVTASTGALTKLGGCDGCPDSGAHSTAQLTGDGYAEFVPAYGQELFAGLGTDLTASTSSSTINYALSFSPGGMFEVRELGVYKADGTWVAGDRFRVAIENGMVVYRQNGMVVYTSQVAPTYPLVLDTTLYSLSASLSQATVSLASAPAPAPTPAPTPSPTPAGAPSRTAVAPYLAVTDRNTYTKPPLPALGPAGSTITDPIFQSTILRVTDGDTRPGTLNRSYRSPSSPHQNAWSANGSYFYAVSDDGTAIPFAFDTTTGTAGRIQPTASGAGGMVLSFYIEPQFSYVNDSIIYGSVSSGNLHTIDQYDFSTGLYTHILDLESFVSGLSGTYIGGIASSDGPTERIMTMFGGTSQDHHHFVVLFDRANPSNRLLLDTWASTLNGAPTSSILNFSLHHVAIDRSGRYLMLYPTSADQTGTRKAPQSVAWDTQTGVFTEMPVATHPYGHDSFGYGVSVNQDCCVSTTYDGVQWQFRNLSTPPVTRDVLPVVLQPQEIYVEDHSTWHNARSDSLLPYISGIFRYGTQNGAWRALDDEIVAVESDVIGSNPTIWRFAQHRTDVSYDGDPTRVSFWYEPRPNVSHDGHWVMFTSNWEKTLGTDPVGDTGAGFRQDVFIVKLESASSPVPPPPPTRVPVAINTTTLPSGRATVPYTASLQATGGTGAYAWSVSSGSLPTGLTLATSTGAITGTPAAAATSTFTVSVSDASDATNTANRSFSIAIATAPVQITTASLPNGRVSTLYSASLQASGGGGGFAWTVTSGALPAGLSLATSTGALSGTPTATGTFSATITATDAADATNATTASYTIVIGAAGVRITTTSLPAGRAKVYYSATESATGGSGSFTWSVTSGALPGGLTLNASTGEISGIPTTAGTYTVTIAATDAYDATDVGTMAYSIAISAAVKITSPRTLPNATRYVFYSYQVTAANVQGTPKWDLAGGSMPPGITLNAGTGVISGTCTKKGTWYFNVRVTDVSTDNTLTMGLTVK